MTFVDIFFLGASLIATIVVYGLCSDRWEARAPLAREILPHKKEENAKD